MPWTRLLRATAALGFLFLPRPAASEPPVVIPVTVAVDDGFRADPLWTHSIARAFTRANGLIGTPLGIRFKVERRAGWTPAGATLDDYLGRLRAQIGVRPDGLVVGLTCRRPEPRRVFGATDYVDALTVLSVPSPGEAWDRELAHELGHVLGAIDVEGGDGLMAGRGPGDGIDAMNAGLMQAHRNRRFPPARFPLEGAELDDAARLYQEAALIAPAEAYPALIRVERARGDLQSALHAAVKLVALRPDGRSLDLRAQVLADLGRLDEPTRTRSGRREEAIASYRHAVELDPDNAPALADLARLLLEAGRPEEALDRARRAVKLQPGLQAAQVNLAAAYLATGDAIRAEAEARHAVAAGPSSFEAHEVSAGALIALGRQAEAVPSIEAALRVASGDAARTARVGVAFEHAGLQARAREAFEAALQVDPLQPLALAGRGRLRLHASDAAGAAADLERAVQQDAEVATGWVNLAAAYLQLGRDREAEDAIREELRRRPRSPQALTNLALVQQLRGELEGALELQERAADVAPDDPAVLANLGALLTEAGRGAEALQVYLRLLELRPDDGPCHNDVAVLYFRQGQFDAARRHAARALALGAPVSRDFLAALSGAPGGGSDASAR